MTRVIGVECWADYYFFWKLLGNESLIRKEKNKNEVLKSLYERGQGVFRIGIVDKDRWTLNSYFKEDVVESEIKINEFVEVAKLRNNCHFVIQLCPDEFESWLVDFIELHGSSINDFGYNNVQEFKNDSKSILEKLQRNERFLEVTKFVLERVENTNNHVKVVRRVLNYLIEKNYKVDINDLNNG